MVDIKNIRGEGAQQVLRLIRAFKLDRITVSDSGGLTVNSLTATNGVTPASGSSVLDDYEEGTYTPSFTGLETVTYSGQLGRYTKIGNLVHFSAALTWTTADTTDGSGFAVTLPFINAANAFRPINVSFDPYESDGFSLSTADNIVFTGVDTGSSVFARQFNNSFYTYNGGQMQSAGSFVISGVYETLA